METPEKVYCCENPTNSVLASLLANKNNSAMDYAALLNGGMGNQWNNPFVYLVWMMFANRFFGNGEFGNGQNAQNIEVQNQLSALREQMNGNQNTNLMMDAIKGNNQALTTLGANLNCDFNTLQQAVCGVQAAIQQVAGQVGFSAERVINAVNQGDLNMIQQMKDCCCTTQKAILTQGYEAQLQNERLSSLLGSKIDSFRAAEQLQECQYHGDTISTLNRVDSDIVAGLSKLGYQASADKAEMIKANNDNTQRILDWLNGNKNLELSQALQDEKFKNSQLTQTQQILQAMKGCACSA